MAPCRSRVRRPGRRGAVPAPVRASVDSGRSAHSPVCLLGLGQVVLLTASGILLAANRLKACFPPGPDGRRAVGIGDRRCVDAGGLQAYAWGGGGRLLLAAAVAARLRGRRSCHGVGRTASCRPMVSSAVRGSSLSIALESLWAPYRAARPLGRERRRLRSGRGAHVALALPGLTDGGVEPDSGRSARVRQSPPHAARHEARDAMREDAAMPPTTSQLRPRLLPPLRSLVPAEAVIAGIVCWRLVFR